jgi:hypothetical protein
MTCALFSVLSRLPAQARQVAGSPATGLGRPVADASSHQSFAARRPRRPCAIAWFHLQVWEASGRPSSFPIMCIIAIICWECQTIGEGQEEVPLIVSGCIESWLSSSQQWSHVFICAAAPRICPCWVGPPGAYPRPSPPPQSLGLNRINAKRWTLAISQNSSIS